MIVTLVFFTCCMYYFKIKINIKNTCKAVQYIFEQENWRELDKIYLNKQNIFIKLFNPLVWTYKQQFHNLEHSKNKSTCYA